MTDNTWLRALPLGDLEGKETLPFRVETDVQRLFGFVVQKNGERYVYENTCPHLGRALDMRPNGFLTRDRSQIICMAHGAVFEIDTGLCCGGPCLGASLTRIETREEEGWLLVAVAPVDAQSTER